jgi:MFS family permease
VLDFTQARESPRKRQGAAFSEEKSEMRKITGRISKNVLILGVVSFLTDASSDMIYPLLPLFLSEVLGAGTLFIGLIEGVAESTASILKIYSGWLSDRLAKRKQLVAVGYGLAALAKPVLSLTGAAWQVLILRFADRAGKGVRTSPRDALIADSTEPPSRGISYGFHRAMDSAGAVLGPLLAFLILPLVNRNYRILFLIASVPALLAVMILLVLLREKKASRESTAASVRLSFAGFDRRFKVFILAVAVFTLGNSSDAFLLLRARDLNVGIVYVPLLWMVMHLVYSLVSSPAGALSDRIGRKSLIVSGLLVYVAVYVGFALAVKPSHLWLLFASYGLYYGLADGNMRAFVADLVGEEKRGLAFGLYHGAVGLTALPASLIFGWIWQLAGASAAFAVGAGLALLAVLVLVLGL